MTQKAICITNVTELTQWILLAQVVFFFLVLLVYLLVIFIYIFATHFIFVMPCIQTLHDKPENSLMLHFGQKKEKKGWKYPKNPKQEQICSIVSGP